jgi:hypothetical protein
MGRVVNKSCDVCKRPTEAIVAKLHYIPLRSGGGGTKHSDYTHHADVGICCSDKLLKLFNFQKRVTMTEYQERRRGNHVGSGSR